MNNHFNSAYFAPLVLLPTIITKPGRYVTRCGEIVTLDATTTRHNFGCRGVYPNGVKEGWHHSGRILSNRETDNDIVKPFEEDQ